MNRTFTLNMGRKAFDVLSDIAKREKRSFTFVLMSKMTNDLLSSAEMLYKSRKGIKHFGNDDRKVTITIDETILSKYRDQYKLSTLISFATDLMIENQ